MANDRPTVPPFIRELLLCPLESQPGDAVPPPTRWFLRERDALLFVQAARGGGKHTWLHEAARSSRFPAQVSLVGNAGRWNFASGWASDELAAWAIAEGLAMPDPPTRPPALGARLLNIASVRKLTTLAQMTIYEQRRRGAFPVPVRLGGRVRWLSREIDHWTADRIALRDKAAPVYPVFPMQPDALGAVQLARALDIDASGLPRVVRQAGFPAPLDAARRLWDSLAVDRWISGLAALRGEN